MTQGAGQGPEMRTPTVRDFRVPAYVHEAGPYAQPPGPHPAPPGQYDRPAEPYDRSAEPYDQAADPYTGPPEPYVRSGSYAGGPPHGEAGCPRRRAGGLHADGARSAGHQPR